MGSRGPAPTPTPILESRGSWRAKERSGEPYLPVERPSCPDWLRGEARAEWNRQVKQLERMRCLAKIDRALLAAYCEAWGEFVEVSEKLRQTGLLLKSAETGVLYQSPLVGIRNRAVERLMRLAQQFGFSPAARTRLRAVEGDAGGEGEDESKGKSRFFRTVG